MITNLIEIAYLQETCFLSQNIAPNKFQPVIEMAQEDLRDILNQPLYDEIVSQFSTTPKTLSTENAALYEYIKKFLAWQTNFYWQKFANSDSTPTGQREFNDENSSLLTDVKMFSFEKNIRERATNYKFKLITFLRTARANDTGSYPKWVDSCTEEMSFAITSVQGRSNTRYGIFKATRLNE